MQPQTPNLQPIYLSTLIPILLITLLSTLPSKLHAQANVEDPFIIEKKGLFNSMTFIRKSGFTLTPIQIVEYMSADQNMSPYSGKLGGLLLLETLFNATGSVMTVWPLVQLHFLDQTPNKNLTWIGLGAVTSALVIRAIFMKKAVKAARYYNNGYSETPSVGIEIGMRGTGVGVSVRF